MHAICTLRFNAAIGREAPYYRLKESYRDVRGNVHSLVLLNVGFEPSLAPRQMHRIANFLSDLFANRNTPSLFKERTDDITDIEYAWAEEFWQRMVNEGHIDRFERKEEKAREEAGRYVDLETMEHTDARNVGAECLCKQATNRLGSVTSSATRVGRRMPSTRLSHISSCALCMFLPSGLPTASCATTRLPVNSTFIRYSSILEGNAADPASLPDMVRTLALKSGNTGRRTLVVMDAGIATNGNLMMLRRMGFDYLCVSRTRLKDYVISPDCDNVEVSDCRGHKITLRRIEQEEGGDIFYEVASPSKALTEASMNRSLLPH